MKTLALDIRNQACTIAALTAAVAEFATSLQGPSDIEKLQALTVEAERAADKHFAATQQFADRLDRLPL